MKSTMSPGTILISRNEVAKILSIKNCMDAVEHAFKLFGEGKVKPPSVLGIYVSDGGFHIKAGVMNLNRNYFVAKTNANFPGNSKKFGLPTIQGVVAVFDADNGQLLALMDSMEITIIRTGAATGVAAKYLSVLLRDARDASLAIHIWRILGMLPAKGLLRLKEHCSK